MGSLVRPLSAAVVGFGLSSWLNGTMFLCQNNIPNKDVICALYLNPALVFHPIYSKCVIPRMETSSSLWHWHKPLNSQLEGVISPNVPPALIAQKLYPPLTNTNAGEDKINGQEATCPD